MSSYFVPQSSLHTAIIMDGNGRWAMARGMPRIAGHRAGVETVTRVVEAAPALGISVLTLFAFSSDNWRRPAAEVEGLMSLLAHYLERETPRCVANGIAVEAIGRRDRLNPFLRASIEGTETATSYGTRLHLRIAVDYSARAAIIAAANSAARLSTDALGTALGPPVDLLIRTGGEQRLSDFLLWECAFAEFVFLEKRWPDFTVNDLRAALEEFSRRERTRGSLPQDSAAHSV